MKAYIMEGYDIKKLVEFLLNSKWSIYLIIFITTLIVFPNIGRESLELDEIFSATVTLKTSGIKEMFTNYLSLEGSPPLYHLLLFYWGKNFGGSEVVLRFMSYGVVILGITCSYILLCKYFGRRIALIFSALSAFTPGVMFYAQQVRMYALLYSLSCVLSIAFSIYILNIKRGLHFNKKFYFLCFSVVILTCYTHHFGSILVFSLLTFLIVYLLTVKRRKEAAHILLGSIIIGFFAILWPIYQFLYVDMGNHVKEFSWERNNMWTIMLNFSTYLALNKFGFLFLLSLLFPFVVKYQVLFASISKYFILLVPVILIIAVAYLLGLKLFVLSERYFIVIIPLILLFLTFVLYEQYYDKRNYIINYLLGLLIITSYKSYSYKKQNWKAASKFISDHFSPSTCIVPLQSAKDGGFSKLMYASYYLGDEYDYVSDGPVLEKNCGLVYFDGHTNLESIKLTLQAYGINKPYEIIDFNKVYVVIKK
ncbi:glycosyltransferase family 39 protein [Aestuariibaculum lutulentum]|uniref:Glycosyltransferase family 39 protein n=1 Tax=Aestuariibaculum lutulentum TaxID=2920935 RepID=A0ABS9RE57_9FLAO|nr:glycosyltransferase family 39 protein [Aestuariibaculum lutulentum]MCH4551228.1 glycosyltransferase family 39 protein [Aestuariibaculum lutulentum]